MLCLSDIAWWIVVICVPVCVYQFAVHRDVELGTLSTDQHIQE